MKNKHLEVDPIILQENMSKFATQDIQEVMDVVIAAKAIMNLKGFEFASIDKSSDYAALQVVNAINKDDENE